MLVMILLSFGLGGGGKRSFFGFGLVRRGAVVEVTEYQMCVRACVCRVCCFLFPELLLLAVFGLVSVLVLLVLLLAVRMRCCPWK